VLVAEGLALIALAVLLAWPAPIALARARWTARAPAAALVLWQAVGLSGGLSILGAGLTLAVSGLHRSWAAGLAALPGAVTGSGPAGPGPLGWAGLVLAAVAGAWLAGVAVACTARVLARTRRHRRGLDLIARDTELGDAELGAGTLPAAQPVSLLGHPAAAAYTVPGVRPRIVLSQGTLDLLSPRQLGAVLSHELAHARGRHDLVILPFRAWAQTLWFLPAARQALAAVGLLTEMLADDAAVRGHGREPVLAALRALDGAGPPGAGAGARAARLDGDTSRAALPRPAAAAICTAAVVLVCLPPGILLAS
jgi:Zn-dependent protease with chaperone function